MSKHTRGEWRKPEHSKFCNQPVIEIKSNQSEGPNVIAFLWTAGCEDDEQEANARLIWCSPEMLAVCQQLVEWADRNRTINLKGRLAEAVAGARAVLKRIKEKTSG